MSIPRNKDLRQGNSPLEFVLKSVTIQVGAVLASLGIGTVIAFLVQPRILQLLPSEGYGPFISWVAAAIVGYFGGVVVVAIVGFVILVVYYLLNRDKYDFF